MRFLRRLAAAALALALAASASGDAPAADLTRKVSLDAEDAALPTVLKILAEKGDLNIVTGPGVTSGRITIRMKDVPIEQAVNLVVRAAGLAYERIGNSILVAEPRALQDETGLSSYVVNLKFADAAEVKEALKHLSAKIEVDRSGNRLVVVTSPRVIAEIQSLVQTLDVPARQVMLEARVVEVGTDDLVRLGIDWEALSSQGFLFVEGNYDSSIGQGNQLRGLKVFPNTPGTSDIFKAKNFSREAKFFNVVVDLLVRDGHARVLANPKLATLNGKEATMLVGSRIPYVISGTVFAGGGAAPVERVEREEVGVKLKITPLINADGYITTTITPEVSSVVGFQGANADLPVVATRQATTTVRLRDGQSVIIGGLLSEEKTTRTSKVPLLGDIPGLGYLFQHNTITTTKKDLVIEITPRILPEQP
uniref:Secretin/TonB short N-terminal domain-containing protein n=1 Tax=Eiseniibacteriota bacterium TaxID=2212470 RepID=A0A832MND3_UNCEI